MPKQIRMQKLTVPGIVFLISLFIFSSCSKPNTSTPNNNSTSGEMGNFTTQVIARQATQATINWTIPAIPAGSTLHYKVFLSNNLLQDNITDVSFIINNLLPGQSYPGKVVAYISSTDSATSNFNISMYHPGPTDSTFVLSKVTDAEGLKLNIDYDNINKRLSSWSETYTSYYDSTKIMYDAAGRVLSTVRRYSFTTPFTVIPNIFKYDAQGRVIKVYHKSNYSTDLSYAYATTLTLPLDFFYEIATYDSITYDGLNRVHTVYNFDQNTITATPLTEGVYTSYKVISYTATNDSLVSKIETYSINAGNTFDLTNTVNFDSYSDKINPYYSLFRKCYQLGVANYWTYPTSIPHYYFPHEYNDYLTTSPYICTSINNGALNFEYNSDGLVSSCIRGADIFEWVHFEYSKVPR